MMIKYPILHLLREVIVRGQMDLHVLQRVHGYLGAYSFYTTQQLLFSSIGCLCSASHSDNQTSYPGNR